MDATTIDELRRRLDSDREQIVTQLVDMGVDPSTGVPDGESFNEGFADSGQATAEKARILSIAEGLLQTKREIDAALKRVEDGSFGRCESCGEAIPPERLEARPFARLCMKCARRAQ